MNEYKNTIFDTEVGLYKNCFSKKMERPIKLYNWLFSDKGANLYKPLIDEIRAENDPHKRLQLKQKLPVITPTGVFKDRSKKMEIFSGFIPIDIDWSDNKSQKLAVDENGKLHGFASAQNMREYAKDYISSQVPGGAYVGRSASNGIFALLYIGTNNKINTPDNYKAIYNAIEKRFAEDGFLFIDSSKSNLNSIRFYSMDEACLYDLDPGKWTEQIRTDLVIEERLKSHKNHVESQHIKSQAPALTVYNSDQEKDLLFVIEQSKKHGWPLCADREQNWFKIGLALANTYGESGRGYFHDLSAVSYKYDYQDCEKKYKYALSYCQSHSLSINVQYIFKQAKDLGLHYSARYKDHQ